MRIAAVLAWVLIFTSACEGEARSQEQDSDPVYADLTLDQKLQRLYDDDVFSGTIAVIQNDEFIYNKAFGYADRGSARANDMRTISDIGSIAKTFTAAAVLKLHESQQLSIDDPLKKHFSALAKPTASITIRQLLTHKGGMDNFHNETDFDPMTRAEAERLILNMPLVAKPGEKTEYSNAAYTLLAIIVERTSGQPFQSYIEEHLLKPLKLEDTGFYEDKKIDIGRIAKGYGGEASGQTTFERPLTWALIGAGGMVSTLADLQTWMTAIHHDPRVSALKGDLLVEAEMGQWSLGSWASRRIEGTKVRQMGGSTNFGYTALAQSLPEHCTTILLVLNSYSKEFGPATHHKLARKTVIPSFLRELEGKEAKSCQADLAITRGNQ